MTNNKLILVADASVAHFYTYQAGKIKERLQTIAFDKVSSNHHEQINKEDNLKADTSDHKSDLKRESKEHDRQDFSSTVADHLNKLCQNQAYTNLIIIAEPKFLGSLRKNINKQTTELVEKEVAKDLIHADVKDIESQLESI